MPSLTFFPLIQSVNSLSALNEAVARYGAPEIVNTDQGSQFSSADFVQAVKACGAQQSMDGRGCWRDNVFVERLWRSVKYERVYLRAYGAVSEAKIDVAQYIDWYNCERVHSSIEDRPPEQAYWELLPKIAQAA
mgnify:CR=1 FL=1